MIIDPKLELLLEEIGTALDLSEAQYAAVVDRYEAVARHLSKDDSLLKDFNPDIMPQGSFLLGTMIKPILEDDELDVDIVCRLRSKRTHWAQFHLKQEVGEQIKKDDRYENMLDKEGRRCWTLLYAEDTKFHLDILPSVVSEDHFSLLERRFTDLSSNDIEALSIRITDKTLPNYKTDTNLQNWLKSNPFGYAAWFNDRKMTTEKRRNIPLNESIKPLPRYEKKKEPLQRVIQILKRHRDIMFGGDEHKPISIIITTLAAKSYRGETSIFDALINILSSMENHIKYIFSHEHQKKIAWIENPVNDTENFADKWADTPQKEEYFYLWINKAKEDFATVGQIEYTLAYRNLKGLLGTRAVNEGFRNAGLMQFINESYLPSEFDSTIFKVPHRENPKWPLNLKSHVEIHGHYKNGKKSFTIFPTMYIPKGCDIYFTAGTNVKRPFDVYWQVVNTGEEAQSQGGLRGQIFHSKTLGKGGLRQKEFSSYTGTHWIQCFIVKDGICVARSYEFIINIK